MDSKKASVIVGIAPVMMNGNAEKNAVDIHTRETIANPSLIDRLIFPLVKKNEGKLIESVIAEESNIPFKSDSLYKKDQMAANNIVNPSKVVRAARTLSIERTCIHLIK
tara:strand:- start:2693 stop:3019 length:327 start_codon:yes stop_codon:yes gene_type:complete